MWPVWRFVKSSLGTKIVTGARTNFSTKNGAMGLVCRPLAFVGLSLGSVAIVACVGSDAEAANPLENAHAHNAYCHDRPILDALEQGFSSVEAGDERKAS